MKNVILPFCLFFSLTVSFNSFSQGSYSNYLDQSSQWTLRGSYVYYHPGCEAPSVFATDISYIWYTIEGDTAVNSTTYYKLYSYRIDSTFCSGELYSVDTTAYTIPDLIREDSTQRIVRYWNGTEEVLQNFDLEVGDTTAKGKCIVGSIDSVLFGSRWLKKFICSCDTEKYVVEGIGSTDGLFESPDCGTPFHGGFYLACYKKDDASFQFIDEECPQLFTSIAELHGEMQIVLSPNPTTGMVSVSGGADQLEMYDSMGRLLKTAALREGTAVDLGGYPAGMYSIRLYKNANASWQKLVIH